jgi:hypothetical protein
MAGDYNSQTIMTAIQSIVAQIEASSAAPEEKNEAKSRLQKFLSHPLVVTLVGTAAGAIASGAK